MRRRASLSRYQSPLPRPLYRCRPPHHRLPRRSPSRRRPRFKWVPWYRSTAKPRICERSMLHRARAMAAMVTESPCHHHLVQAPTINIPRLAVHSKMRCLTCGGHWGVRSPRWASRLSGSKRQPSRRPPQRSCRSLKMLSARTGPHACAPQDNFSGRRFRERTLNSGEPVQLNLHPVLAPRLGRAFRR